VRFRDNTVKDGNQKNPMAVSTILLILLLVLLIGALPAWPYSRSWGYYPSGGLGLILVIVLVIVLLGGI
jgi:hypothetical protein